MRIPKSYSEFNESLLQETPSELWPEELRALWWDAKGNWQASHAIIENLHTQLSSWVHAYLHRKEGDRWNASYWYGRAGKPFSESNLQQELEELVTHTLKRRS